MIEHTANNAYIITWSHPAAMQVKLEQSAGGFFLLLQLEFLIVLSVKELPVTELCFPFPL